METKVKHREWVKTAAIVFLSVLLVLTFFSNTIMNHSLPEVAAQYVESGSINARIRGTGTVSANEVYDVTLTQTRKIRSVAAKVGQQVSAGDVLFQLESMESEELKTAQETLDTMELNYQKSLIEASNTSSTEDHNIQKLRDDYNEALAAYRLYSSQNPDQLELVMKEAELELSAMEQKMAEFQGELTRLQNDKDYQAAKAEITGLEAQRDAALKSYEELQKQQDEIVQRKKDIDDRKTTATASSGVDWNTLYADYEQFMTLAGDNLQICTYNLDYFKNLLIQKGDTAALNRADVLQKHYNLIAPIIELQKELPTAVEEEQLARNLQLAIDTKDEAERQLGSVQSSIENHENSIEQVQSYVDAYTDAIAKQKAIVSNFQNASAAATTLKAAQEALEDAVFQASLGDSSNLDIQAAKEAIEKQKKVVEELTKEADGQEIKAPVSGTVTAINVSAGGTAPAEEPIAQITVADRGYTVPINVTAEQARQVKVGDTAEITNYYWGNITATLENIASDPKSMGQGKILIFRIEGEGIEAGTNLTLSIGQRSANYDCLVPNSAVRTDSNGSFVLVVVAKPSPLGNRYVATRVDVQVLASDDTTSAVSGLARGDFVITTSNKPLEAGESVRLPDNG